MDKWYRLLSSVIDGDRAAMQKYSLEVGYLTGEEHEVRTYPDCAEREISTDPILCS